MLFKYNNEKYIVQMFNTISICGLYYRFLLMNYMTLCIQSRIVDNVTNI